MIVTTAVNPLMYGEKDRIVTGVTEDNNFIVIFFCSVLIFYKDIFMYYLYRRQ